MRISLAGKKALITGSTAGIGYACARGLARAGAEVYLNGRTPQRVDHALNRLREEVPEAVLHGVAADVGRADDAEKIFAAAPSVDILINNAAIYEKKTFFELADDDWERTLAINLLGPIRLARHYGQRMVKSGWGRLIFISSDSGVQIPPEWIHYGVSKTAILAVARGLAETLANTGVTVNSVIPGPTLTESVERYLVELGEPELNAGELERAFLETARPTSLIKRFATPEEVANLVTYVASKEASATTGAALRADGGVIRSIF
jgi:NAD(P)-dependent dehydrogenase (short-subunit alcohol dehydrogenase family)